FFASAPAREARERFNPFAFFGQTAVRVRGPVQEGDLLLPSGENDGVAVATAPSGIAPGAAVIGTAWEASASAGVKLINTAIGMAPAHTGPAPARRTARRTKT